MDAQFSNITAISSTDNGGIYDIAFNHYGNRMAMCCSNQFVTVWNKINDWNEWIKTADWKAHTTPPLKITWVHPEFGQALATCSSDRSVAIWEEMLDIDRKIDQGWVRKTSILVSTALITDIKFAPKNVGLLLAICSSDDFIRIFKALDVLDLSRWCLLQQVSYRHRPKCIAWNPNGTSDNHSFKYFKIDNIDESDELNRDVGSIYSLYPRVVYEPTACLVLSQDPMLVVGFDDEQCKTDDKIKLLLYASHYQRWNKTEFSIKDKCISKITNPICDLAFANRLGRTYDLLAVASSDIKIFALYQVYNQSHSSFKFQWLFCLMYSLPCDHYSIWRISWNPFGNILISAGDDGNVRLWKQYQVLIKKEDKRTTKQKTIFRMKHLEHRWESVKIIKMSDFQS